MKAPAHWCTPLLSFPKFVLILFLSLDFFPTVLFFLTFLVLEQNWTNMEVLLLVEVSFDVWIWWKINRVSEVLRKELVVWPGYLVLQTTMGLFFFYKPLNKASKLHYPAPTSTSAIPAGMTHVPMDGDGNFGVARAVTGSFPMLWWASSWCRNNPSSISKDVGCDLLPPLHKGPIKALVPWGIVFTKARAFALQDLWSYFIVTGVLWMLWKPKNVSKLVEMGFVVCGRRQSDPH